MDVPECGGNQSSFCVTWPWPGVWGFLGGEVSLVGCEAVSLRDKLSWAGGVVKDLRARYSVLWRERGLRLSKGGKKGQGVGTEAKQGGVLMHRN